jgi:hypothetical protein|tara:strand:- start:705 stop:902 length:198 start_codon:yes stop_codon:yes gene_type:complete
MIKECEQQWCVEIGQCDSAWRSTKHCSRIVEEQAQSIPIRRDGLRADRALFREMIEKESLHERRQ